MKKIVLRVDAFTTIGTGHLMRSLALAQGLKNNGNEVFFITYCESEKLIKKIEKEGFKTLKLKKADSLEETMTIIKMENPDWAVLDGYHFDHNYQKSIKEIGYKLLYIDDYAHLKHYYADIILNQNYGAEKFSYNSEPYTKILIGTKFVLLRQEFLEYEDFKRDITDIAKKILITLGGADPENNTLKILKAVNLIKNPLEVIVVIGVSNSHYDSLKQEAEKGNHNIEILTAVDNMAPLMAKADIAVSAGGTTTWELAFMGLPSLLCIVAENQENAVDALVKNKIFKSSGWIKDKTADGISNILLELIQNKITREKMSQKAKATVDGKGTYRVIDTMEKEIVSHDYLATALRRDIDFGEVRFINFVNLHDEEKEMVRTWRNSDEVRHWMFSDHFISREEHLKFITKLHNDDVNFYWMAIINKLPVGVIYLQRVDIVHKNGYLGIYSVRKGSGSLMLNGLLKLWFDVMQMKSIKCELLSDNKIAYKFYTKFGFVDIDSPCQWGKADKNKPNVFMMELTSENWSVYVSEAK